MVAHAKKTVLANLKTVVSGATGVKAVYDFPMHSDELINDDSKIPAVTLRVGDERERTDVTSSRYSFLRIVIAIYAKTRDALLDADEAIKAALDANPTLSGACLYCKPECLDPPDMYEQPFIAVRVYEAMLRKDF